MLPITEIAAKVGILEEELELYGRYKAKSTHGLLKRLESRPDARSSTSRRSPTPPLGEGKTSPPSASTESMNAIGNPKTMLALREPSLGRSSASRAAPPAAATSQLIPMEDLNLHFTGDIHAGRNGQQPARRHDRQPPHARQRAADRPAHHLVAALRRPSNDRAMREIVNGLGGRLNGLPRARPGYRHSTVASEVMAILGPGDLAQGLRERLGRITFG